MASMANKDNETLRSRRQVFTLSGPLHLKAIDWRNLNHRRSVAASLIQGVYVLEHDRQQQRLGPKAEAPPWWQAMHFRLIRALEDPVDNSVFGAIYELKVFASNYCHSTQEAPRYVIAFRGKIAAPGADSFWRDFKLDFLCLGHRLHKTTRFRVAMEAVQELVAAAGPRMVWLSGYSLGSLVALLVGKNQVKAGYPVETYLFNPPFLSTPVENIKYKELRSGIRISSSFLKAGLARAFKDKNQMIKQEHAFAMMSSWYPYLFVNPADPICSEYIGYFQQRVEMEEIGAGKIGRLATQTSIAHLLSGSEEMEPLHLIPSAYMTINLTKSPSFREAHAIHQWWVPNPRLESVQHKFRK